LLLQLLILLVVANGTAVVAKKLFAMLLGLPMHFVALQAAKATGGRCVGARVRSKPSSKKARLLGRAFVQGPGVGTRVGSIKVLIV
jgi:hypothetical protein